MKLKIAVSKDRITTSLIQISKELATIPRQAHQQFVELTPKDTGNARSKTKLNRNVIEADYAYAKRLDKGYSKQSPKGMTAPLRDWMRRKLQLLLRKR